MDRILIWLAHALERRLDAHARRSMPGHSRRAGSKLLLLLILLPALLGGALSMKPILESKMQQRLSPAEIAEREALAAYRAGFPEGAIVTANGRNETLRHRCGDSGVSADSLARSYYDFSAIFQRSELSEELRSRNPHAFDERGRCRDGAEVAIPQPLLGPLRNKPLGIDILSRPVEAVYMRGENFRPGRVGRELARLREIGANGVVFDVKDILGVVNYRSRVEEVERYRRHQPPIENLEKTIQYLHSQDIYVIARMALFQDENLAIRRPDLAIKDRGAPGGILLVKGKPLWVDAGRPEVHNYNLKIVRELVELGVDEIQFDYVRYPAEGDLAQVVYHNLPDAAHKTDHLVAFLSGAWMMTRFTGVNIGIDIFGIVAWGEEVDVRATGQRIERLTAFVDVVSPMLYPSHFNKGFDGFENPADEGYHFYYQGVKRVLEKSAKQAIVVRPWLQAFRWRVNNYNEQYIRDQIRGSNAGGGLGWMMWNASNDYDIVYRALRKHALTGTEERRSDRI